MSATQCTCNGKGSYGVEHPEETIGNCTIGGFTTHLCACRVDEPPREGNAAWWTMETIKTLEWESPTGLYSATATIERERPVSEDNHRLIRTDGNVLYPTMARVEAEFGSVGLMDVDLRSLADWLRRVADEVERIDEDIS